MKRKYFGTDGIRGAFGGPVINEIFAAQLGTAAGRWLIASGRQPGARVLLGRDTRASGEPLLRALAGGLHAEGFRPVDLGILPTPAVSRAVRQGGAALGVVITASHNPSADNGIKFFAANGAKLSDADELAIECHLREEMVPPLETVECMDARSSYIDAAAKILPAAALQGWRIAVDAAHGATAGTTPFVLRALGAEVLAIGDAPDGKNINDGVGSEHPELLAAKVRETRARLGIAHDGDGDRCILCDERGDILDGDEILTLLATHALAAGTLANRMLVVTVQSNLGVDKALAAAGGRVCRTDVGDRYVCERMIAEGASLGGEASGHIICLDSAPTGDGLVAALKVIEVMRQTGRPLSELRCALRKFPQQTTALRVREKRELAECPALSQVIRALETAFGGEGRVLVRYSGTEAKLRLLVEGPDEAVVTAALGQLTAAARTDLAVI